MLVASSFLLDFTEGFPNINHMRTKRQATIDDVGTKVGCLKTRSHKVTGEVYFINNSSQLYIKDFTFDGLGFGVYFYVALQGAKRPFSRKNSVAVNWPDPLSAERTPIKKAFNKQDIVINLPSDKSGDKVVWLSLWCEEFGISFGDLVFKSKKPRENSCAPGAKKAQLAALANPQLQLPALTDQQLAVLANNPLLLQQLRQQGLLLELQLLQG
jgi:hypothetical protein